ncbi:MAG: aminotransferase class V-fold PLP-dependent enzyme [Bauldia sp.]
MPFRPGRHFLHIPGPGPIPDRILNAISMPVVDQRGPDFPRLSLAVLDGMKEVFQTAGKVLIYPSSGTGAWESAIVNTLSPGDKVLMVETGHFAALWQKLAADWGLDIVNVATDWRRGADPAEIEARLAEDRGHTIKAVMVVHNETATGALSRVGEIRQAMDRVRHPALFMVDAISSLGSVDFRHDEWGVDVTVAGSQKGMMLPAGLSFLAISEKALAATKTAKLPRSYFKWEEMLKPNATGYFPYTPAVNLLYGLKESLAMLREEGLANVYLRHLRLAAATRAAVRAWGLEVLCQEKLDYSPTITAVLLPPRHDADRFRQIALDNYNISLGMGLSKVAGKVFRIGHLGDTNALSLAGALSGVEMALGDAGFPHRNGGVSAELEVLSVGEQAAAAVA